MAICQPYLRYPGESTLFGTLLKIESTVEPTPPGLEIAIDGQHHGLARARNFSKKSNRMLKWVTNPIGALAEQGAEKLTEAAGRKLAGTVFAGGWESMAGHFIRYTRACSEALGPGAYVGVTTHQLLILRAPRPGGMDAFLVHAVPRQNIAGVRAEGTKDAMLRGREPRVELHFADRSMVAVMMGTGSGQRFCASLGY
ncbi:MAG: hypothetical protein J2P18_08905 [Nocardia sp.]|nr:hypothetical protein [Nocardia sp.]